MFCCVVLCILLYQPYHSDVVQSCSTTLLLSSRSADVRTLAPSTVYSINFQFLVSQGSKDLQIKLA